MVTNQGKKNFLKRLPLKLMFLFDDFLCLGGHPVAAGGHQREAPQQHGRAYRMR